MEFNLTSEPATSIEADAIVIGCYEKEPLAKTAATVDEAMGGALTRLVEAEEITGKHGDLTTLLAPAGIPSNSHWIACPSSRGTIQPGTCRPKHASHWFSGDAK